MKQCIRSGGGGKICFEGGAGGAGFPYRGLYRPSDWLSGRAGTGRAALEGAAGAAGAFRRRLCRVFRPVFDGPGGGSVFDGGGLFGQTAWGCRVARPPIKGPRNA